MASNQGLGYIIACCNEEPTLIQDLVPALADFGGYCNTSQAGAGGFGLVWQKNSHPLSGG